MPDPLSIATAVIALLEATLTVGSELKKFHDGVLVVKSTIDGLLKDVEGLSIVLESMRDTFETVTAEFGSGNVATLWQSVARALEDGKEILGQLHERLQEINKDTRFMDGPRKYMRLNFATDQIAGFRQHVQSYRDTLQLSLQTIILWEQVTCKKSIEQILPNLSELHQDVRRLASKMDHRIEDSASMVATRQEEVQAAALNNLRDCVRSAASVMSSASSVIASEEDEDADTVLASDFGDCLPPQPGIMISRWMESRTAYDYDGQSSEAAPRSIADIMALDAGEEEDSEVELENEQTVWLFELGRQKHASGDKKAAERILRNCLSRLGNLNSSKPKVKTSSGQPIELQVLEYLFDLYYEQQRWSDAQSVMTKKMAFNERLLGKNDPNLLTDVLSLAKVLQAMGAYVESQLNARRALRGFRTRDDFENAVMCLRLLIDICGAANQEDEREAYSAMLSGMLAKIEISQTVVERNEILKRSEGPEKAAPIEEADDWLQTTLASIGSVVSSERTASEVTTPFSNTADAVLRPESQDAGKALNQTTAPKNEQATLATASAPLVAKVQQGEKKEEEEITSAVQEHRPTSRERRPRSGQSQQQTSGPEIRRKLVIVGDPASGKTCLSL